MESAARAEELIRERAEKGMERCEGRMAAEALGS